MGKHKKIGSKTRFYFFLLIYSILFWNIAIRVAIFLKFLGSGNDDFRSELPKGLVLFEEQILWASVIVTAFAIFSWFLNYFVFDKIIQRRDVRKILISVFFIDTLIFIIMGVGLGMAHYNIERGLTLSESFSKMEDFLFNPTILFFLVVVIIVSFVFQLIHTLFQQVGYGVLWRLMAGYYRIPREEEKIFLFLDLQSSTICAERLGHARYSDFIQDCFRMLTESLLATFGRVYQYVGDEVVITWNAKKKKNFKKAVDFYFMYSSHLESKAGYFEKKYGLVPVFTASLNSGKVMAVEVGDVKHELAYHGDVLNTAARIQKQCKRYRKPLLATQDFIFNLAQLPTNYSSKFVDDVKFLGKDTKVKLYEVY